MYENNNQNDGISGKIYHGLYKLFSDTAYMTFSVVNGMPWLYIFPRGTEKSGFTLKMIMYDNCRAKLGTLLTNVLKGEPNHPQMLLVVQNRVETPDGVKPSDVPNKTIAFTGVKDDNGIVYLKVKYIPINGGAKQEDVFTLKNNTTVILQGETDGDALRSKDATELFIKFITDRFEWHIVNSMEYTFANNTLYQKPKVEIESAKSTEEDIPFI
jgi:hypothetical protein